MLTAKRKAYLPTLLFILTLVCGLSACVGGTQAIVTNTVESSPQPSPSPTQTLTPIPTQPDASPSAMPVYAEERASVEALMNAYGQVDSYQLSDAYWQTLTERIAKYGAAQRITMLEYHSDSYSMFGGAYAMNPESFRVQIEYLLANDYHFVSIHEARGFVEGWLDLPARSVLLSSDPSPRSHEAVRRMLALFTELAESYGARPYINLFLLTQGLGADEKPLCAGDACWQAYRDASASGYFSINSHGHSHPQPGTLDAANTLLDIQTSLALIEAHLGIRPYALSWPYEVCSPYPQVLTEAGIHLAFAGWTRAIARNYLYPNDVDRGCLPRMLPPNPDGLSIRPPGQTLEQILQGASKGK